MNQNKQESVYIRPQYRISVQQRGNHIKLEMQDQQKQNYFNIQTIPHQTLDQGACKTLANQLLIMLKKFKVVILPCLKEDKMLLSDWDLWGPFLMCLIFGILVNDSFQLLMMFAIVFGGAIVLTFNSRILGGKMSYFQSISMLGYCMFPQFLVSIIIKLINIFGGLNNFALKVLFIVIACSWSVLASYVYMNFSVPQQKQFVALYPIFLFFVLIGILMLYI